jgi:transcriptional regulator with XRE-family HTH domain
VTISVEKVRELLARPLSDNTASVLKEWRAQAGYSQAEAAIHLGVPVRTLQGWELGRPMPYPALLHRAVRVPARPADRYLLAQSDFSREFAEFIDFVGAQALDKEIRRIEKKLGALSPGARNLYGDRYFFQEQCIRFTEDIPSFTLNISDPIVVRAASLIAGINRVRRSVSPTGLSRFHSMVIDNLKSDRDMRQLEHEIRCWTHFVQKGFKVVFADLEKLGDFDFLVGAQMGSIEVECKTISEDTGSQVKSELVVNLTESFRKTVSKAVPVDESGLFTLSLKKPADHCRNLSSQLEQAIQSATVCSYDSQDFSLKFSPRPKWQELFRAERWTELDRQIRLDSDDSENARGITRIGDKILALVIRPHAPSVFRNRLVGTIKRASGQCTGKNPGMIWLHLVGFAEQDFLALCEFSMNGPGTGLNAVVADALHPDLSSTDRCHIQLVRFSGDSRKLTHHPVLDSNLILSRAVSHGGACYDVQNPRSRFPKTADL